MYLLLREGMVSRDQPFGEDGRVSLRAEVKLCKNNSSYSISETFATDAFLLHQQLWPEMRASLEEDLQDTTGVPGSLRGIGAS
jgi:hypothetical protein